MHAQLLAGLLGVKSGQDAYIRGWLYERAEQQFTNRLSALRNGLAGFGTKDERLTVPPELGAERRTSSNVLSADADSLSYGRTPAEILRTVYGTGDERWPGGFYPNGGNGRDC
ncbi:hypothetical protein QJS04_geneDACA011610 [Acorus gramineus]|uniref:Uncharacterized protein n=1 Tax=Acorus gramineus TaxID=55184 RepID=A0AAV9BTQ4_ACOGR|nr:hypothetical protein QJS04_geneDACA011610 [Acorus gramineus]